MKKQVLDYIARDIQTQCMRLGINAQFSTEVTKDRSGNDVYEIKSTDFMMMPMIFKDIHVGSRVWIRPAEQEGHPEITKVTVRLTYWYNTFEGGSNGTDLGTVVYAFNTEDAEQFGEKDKNLDWIVRKVQGIQL